MRFAERLQQGKVGESVIARWLRGRGYNVMPVYEIEQSHGKGPQVYTPSLQLVAPDMLVFRGDKCLWVEAKHKSGFTWTRKCQHWSMGIDLKHYCDYCKVDALSPWPLWLLFLSRGEQAKDSPCKSPSGLFGNTLSLLRKREAMRCTADQMGQNGMVFWSVDDLLKLAPLSDLVFEQSETTSTGRIETGND